MACKSNEWACKSLKWACKSIESLVVGIFWRELRLLTLVWLRKVLSLFRIVQMIRGWIRLRFRIRLGLLEMCKWMAFNEGG